MSGYIRQSVEALNAYMPGEQPRDGGLIKLNTNENPYPPSPRVAEVLAGLQVEDLRRYPDPGCSALRECIAGLHGVDPDQVLVGNGSDEVLALCTRAFVENDGTIGYFDATYSLYPVLADIRGVRKRPVPLGPDFTWREPDDGDYALFFLCNPSAPTGVRVGMDAVQRLCEKMDGVVLIDEAYADFADENTMDLALERDNVLVARTLSKSFSMAGLRLGYAVGPVRLVEALMKIKDSYNVDALAQRLGVAALSDVPHMQANVARVRKTRERVRTELESLGVKVWPSETNFLWVQPSALPAVELFETLRKRGILVRYFAEPVVDAYLRITISTDADMDALLEAMKQVLGRG